jgi:hypothetical protein
LGLAVLSAVARRTAARERGFDDLRRIGLAALREDALRAGRDIFRAFLVRLAAALLARGRFLRPALRVPVFALRFAITDVLSASGK